MYLIDTAIYPTQILVPELIPRTSWFNNLRSMVPKSTWDVIRKQCYKDANYRCEICGGKGEKWPVECHEKWRFDDNKGIQYFDGLIALCPMCHKVKHMGFANSIGMYPAARAWMARVNNWPEDLCEIAIQGEFKRWEERSRGEWLIDYSNAPPYLLEIIREIWLTREWDKQAKITASALISREYENPYAKIVKSISESKEFNERRESRAQRLRATFESRDNSEDDRDALMREFADKITNQRQDIQSGAVKYVEIETKPRIVRKLRLED